MGQAEQGAADTFYSPRMQWNIVWRSLFTYKSLAVVASSILLALMGSAARGDTLLFVVMLWRNWDRFHFFSLKVHEEHIAGKVAVGNSSADVFASNATSSGLLDDYYMKDVHYFIMSSVVNSYLLFFGVGGYLQWAYYTKQRNRPQDWKCQPNRFLTKENERHEFVLGAACLSVNATLSGILSAYVYNGGPYIPIYYDVREYGWVYLALSTVALFLMQDALAYYYHRMLHLPFFYRNFHKWHHRYHSPTAFSAVAMHPVESLVFQLVLLFPLMVIPLHFASVIGCFYYLYYFGLVDHSGVDLDSIWPWQPPVMFHDDHHKYFHVNFGFNTLLFDRFHDTLRRKDREYSETIFYGKGRRVKRSD